MALLPSNLEGPLLALFTQTPSPTALAASQQMAKIYANYAATALTPTGSVVITPASQKLLQQTLYAAMAVPLIGLPITMATAWGLGVGVFWLAPPVAVILGPAVGVVTVSAAATELIIPALTLLFSVPLNTAATTAAGMAATLDAATRTVVATVTPPAGTLVPLF